MLLETTIEICCVQDLAWVNSETDSKRSRLYLTQNNNSIHVIQYICIGVKQTTAFKTFVYKKDLFASKKTWRVMFQFNFNSYGKGDEVIILDYYRFIPKPLI